MAKNTLNTQIAAVIRSQNAGAKKLHAVLIACLNHAHDHGDSGPLARLINGLKNTGNRQQGMLAWVEMFTPLNRAKAENGDVKFSLPKNADKRRPWLIADADATPFWSATKEKEVTAYDAIKAIDAIVAKLGKAEDVKAYDANDYKAAFNRLASAIR